METSVVIDNAKFVETTFGDGSKQLVGVVRGDSFTNLDIPSEPNPRQFIGESNPNYKEMVKTLKTEPHMFARKNAGGITIFATACDYNGDGSYTILFKDGEGIANGIHSYRALKAHGTSNSQIKVTIEMGLDKNNISKVAEALNLNKRLQTYSLQNKDGAFDWHKSSVGSGISDVIYHEGDQGTIEIKEAMAFLNLFKYDPENKAANMLENIEKSEHANASFLNRIIKDDQFKSQLRWIAEDVHDIAKHTILNETFAIQLKPLKKSMNQNWVKTRGSSKEIGIMKGLGLLLVSGLAHVGTKLNHNGIVVWKGQFRSEERRKLFINELFKKVFDIVSVEDGSASEIIRQEAVRKKILRHASIIAIGMNRQLKRKKKVS
ncbi:AIPR family protein [Bacillus subtilis]|uniref:AIPR family protein n=1 Tax=Bacillus subtilis TaxID=1423 RepID=UPI0021D97A6B|nr:AIPR family protein [Bacillus subtilis]